MLDLPGLDTQIRIKIKELIPGQDNQHVVRERLFTSLASIIFVIAGKTVKMNDVLARLRPKAK